MQVFLRNGIIYINCLFEGVAARLNDVKSLNWVPSQNLGYRSIINPPKSALARQKRLEKRHKEKTSVTTGSIVSSIDVQSTENFEAPVSILANPNLKNAMTQTDWKMSTFDEFKLNTYKST